MEYFNSHPHEEDDFKTHTGCNKRAISTHILTKRMTKQGKIPNSLLVISTHILTKRMTSMSFGSRGFLAYFNSHPHEEDDWLRIMERWKKIHFNSHPHEEDDDTYLVCLLLYLYFNSHPHEEDDKVKKLELEQNHISTHILTKRMTGFNNYFCIRIVFQLTSSRRG